MARQLWQNCFLVDMFFSYKKTIIAQMIRQRIRIVSLGDFEENDPASNGSQFVRSYLSRHRDARPKESYSYGLKELPADG